MILIAAPLKPELDGILNLCSNIVAVPSPWSNESGEVASELFLGTLPSGISCLLAIVGVGRLQSAVHVSILIERFKPEVVIGTGIAGAISENFHCKDIIIAEACIQYDIDLSTFGLVRGQLEFGKEPLIPCSKDLCRLLYQAAVSITAGSSSAYTTIHKSGKACDHESKNVGLGIIGTADLFVGKKKRIEFSKIFQELNICAVDMEGASMASAAQAARIPFALIRSISDDATGKKVKNFPLFCRESGALHGMIIDLACSNLLLNNT